MKRALVIGSPGAGKSTFARRLRARTGLPLHHLDLLWHRPDRTTVTEAEFDRRLAAILAQDRWILDGNYSRTLAQRLARCDAVFLLEYPLAVCLAGVQARIGRPRTDMPWVETAFDPEFRQFIEEFPQKRLPEIHALLAQCGEGREIHIFRNRAEADRYLHRL